MVEIAMLRYEDRAWIMRKANGDIAGILVRLMKGFDALLKN